MDTEKVVIKARITLLPRFTTVSGMQERPERTDDPTRCRRNEPDILKIVTSLADASPFGTAYPRFTTIGCFENRILRSSDETGCLANHLDTHQIGAKASWISIASRGTAHCPFPAPGFAAVFGLQDSGSTTCDKPEVFIYKVDIIER